MIKENIFLYEKILIRLFRLHHGTDRLRNLCVNLYIVYQFLYITKIKLHYAI